MNWICYILALLWLLDALRLRGRFARLPILRPSDKPPSPGHQFLTSAGVILDERARSAASAFATEQALEYVDLIPSDTPTLEALRLADLVDTTTYRQNRIARGYSAGYGMLISAELARRAPIVDQGPADPISLVRFARMFKRYAPRRSDFAVLSTLRAPAKGLAVNNWLLLTAAIGHRAKTALRLRIITMLLLLGGVVFAPFAAAIAVAAYHVQLLIAFAGVGWRPRDLFSTFLFRTPIEAWTLTKTLWQCVRNPQPSREAVERLRTVYQQMQGNGTLFEARREDCPLCGSRALRVRIRTSDLLQSKPGQFTLERCDACGHIFQNPRLSPAGLTFYYSDFYDGLGEEEVDRLFEAASSAYLDRARLVEGIVRPRRWLDVGTGHGHFCCMAKDMWPETQFDGLDIGESVEDAVRAGWIDASYRGVLPDISPKIAGTYDVVSLFHCLEHNPEPRAELAAAHHALAPGGCIVIEVPDPECAIGRWLGRFWIPWLQPQHLHLFTIGSLQEMLRQEGFEPVRTSRREAHIGFDLLGGIALFLRSLAPPPYVPWRPRPSWFSRVRYFTVSNVGFPVLVIAFIVDSVVATPLSRRLGISNAYRVVARRVERVGAMKTPLEMVSAVSMSAAAEAR